MDTTNLITTSQLPSFVLVGRSVMKVLECFIAKIPSLFRERCIAMTTNGLLIGTRPTVMTTRRFNIRSFMYICHFPDFTRQACIRITLTYPSGSGIQEEHAVVTLADIQKSTFLLLSDLMEQWPDSFPKKMGAEVPEIWITGRGTIVSASYTESSISPAFSLKYMYSSMSKKEIHYRGYRMASMDPSKGSFSAQFPYNSHGQLLFKLWRNLRKIFWSDYQTARSSA
jgi:hypothetical protein